MNIKEARSEFNKYIAREIPKNDIPALNEAWGFYIDSLHRQGLITDRQYHNWCRT